MSKLGKLLDNEELAAKLTAAGFSYPRKIYDAKDSDLRKCLSRSEIERVRARFPRQR